jgi:colicin import membrane protein
MPRKLKTFITNLGFYELAISVPTMKAALEAWGLGHNAFKHGFAKQTDDPKIVAATEAAPGVVLRRPIGSNGPFKEDADLPRVTAAAMTAAKKATPKSTQPSKPAKPPKRRLTPEIKAKPRAPVIDLEKARREREKKEKQEAKERERAEALAQREQAKKDRAVQKAKDALSAARQRHEDTLADLAQRRGVLDAQEEKENDRWEKERHRLEAELFKAKR